MNILIINGLTLHSHEVQNFYDQVYISGRLTLYPETIYCSINPIQTVSMRISTFVVFLWLFTMETILHVINPCYGLCIESERQALSQFKQDLEDPSNRLLSWANPEMDCCKWDGIVCDNLTNNVKELHLGAMELQGNLNPSLLDLKYLNYLDLSHNDFGGIPIPSFIGSLVSLTYLDISESGFDGLIPYSLGNLSSLRHLNFRGTWENEGRLYVENLHWISHLYSLVHLDLSYVNLSVASDWLLIINTLPSLSELHLCSSGLVTILPMSNVNFTSLSILDISFNYFPTSIPTWILNLSNLISLDLKFNSFEGVIPSGFSNLTSLRNLDLSFNNLISPLPNCLFSLNGLISLYLQANSFKGPIPIGFQNMTGLRNLDLSQIDLTKSIIPDWLYNLGHLESLSLSQTNLQGEISSAIVNLTSLIKLDLSFNELEGTLPQTIGSLCNLQVIELHYNKLSGNISGALESFTGCLSLSMKLLKLDGNKFSGNLTEKLGQLSNIQILSLWGNSISGPIPDSLGRLTSLTSIDFRDNQLSGNLPESLGSLTNLEQFQISRNKLEGIVTEVHFANLTNLKTFRASHNHLNLKVRPGWIPPFRVYDLQIRYWNLGPKFPMWLQSQYQFGYLDLSCTGISDTVPDWFWNLTSGIYYLNISHNQIRGQLPSTLRIESGDPVIYMRSNQFEGPLPRISANITELDLSNNSFSGSLSNFFCNTMALSNRLKILHLNENHLSGEIPDCWKNWQSLRVINLGNNNLTGKMPSSVGHLSNLWSFHLRNNSLSGEIPVALGNCTELLILDLGVNKFVGKIPRWMGSSLLNLKVLGLRSNKLNGEISSEFCLLASLQILDLANNNLSGIIPKCFYNLTAMATVRNPSYQVSYFSTYREIMVNAFAVTKGREVEYDTILAMVTSMDISGNRLSGQIPEELTSLLGLRFLNLSGNHLTGDIPKNLGKMKVLESIDLSRNKISGKIPPSMSNLHFLSSLNLSYNNLSGEIPSSTQLQSLDTSSFIGNKLCGPPLTTKCSAGENERGPDTDNESEEEDDGTKVDGFYLGLVLGFVVSFGGIFCSLVYIKSWRHAYFQFLDKMWSRLCA